MKKVLPTNFVYPEIKDTDFVFGAGQVTGDILRPDGDWRPYDTPDEEQRRNGVESSTCFIHAQQSTIASIMEEKFDIPDQNFSERFNLIFSEATPQGGDPLKAAQTFRDRGLIPDNFLPFSGSLKSWEEFKSFKGGDRSLCEKQGKVWREYWEPKYDIVFTKNEPLEEKYRKLRSALKSSPIPISVYGVTDGVTYIKKPKGASDTHMVKAEYVDDQNQIHIKDTYPPFRKVLPANYNSDFAMRWTVEKNTTRQQIGLIQKILSLMFTLLPILKKEEIKPEPIPEPKPQPMEPKYLWDTPTFARHSVRVICDEEGLSVADKNLICAVIACESGFNVNAVRQNTDARKSKDYGICQYNSYWYIGAGKPIPSVEVALGDPEFCVRTMIKMYRKGRLIDWVAYKNGSYKKYL